jgi:hypothetical protein
VAADHAPGGGEGGGGVVRHRGDVAQLAAHHALEHPVGLDDVGDDVAGGPLLARGR